MKSNRYEDLKAIYRWLREGDEIVKAHEISTESRFSSPGLTSNGVDERIVWDGEDTREWIDLGDGNYRRRRLPENE